jgi:hypothetical protein
VHKLVPFEVRSASSAREAIADSDIVLTATNSNVPVFDGTWLEPGTHVTSIMGGNIGLVKAGVARSKRRELDDTSIRRSGVILVNSRDQAFQDEQGDLYDPVQAGFLSWDRVGELGDLLNGKIPAGSGAQQITLLRTTQGRAWPTWRSHVNYMRSRGPRVSASSFSRTTERGKGCFSGIRASCWFGVTLASVAYGSKLAKDI